MGAGATPPRLGCAPPAASGESLKTGKLPRTRYPFPGKRRRRTIGRNAYDRKHNDAHPRQDRAPFSPQHRQAGERRGPNFPVSPDSGPRRNDAGMRHGLFAHSTCESVFGTARR